MANFISLDFLKEPQDIEILKKFLKHPETTFCSQGSDKKILDILNSRSLASIQEASEKCFLDELGKNSEKSIIAGGKIIVLVISFNIPKEVKLQASQADDLIKVLWDPIKIEVFAGGEEVGVVKGNILKMDSDINMPEKKVPPSIILQKRTRDQERRNRYYPFLWVPHEQSSCVYSEYINKIGGKLMFIDNEGEKIGIMPFYIEQFRSLNFAFGAIIEDDVLDSKKFNARTYGKKFPSVYDKIYISHPIHLGKGESSPMEMTINHRFYVGQLL